MADFSHSARTLHGVPPIPHIQYDSQPKPDFDNHTNLDTTSPLNTHRRPPSSPSPMKATPLGVWRYFGSPLCPPHPSTSRTRRCLVTGGGGGGGGQYVERQALPMA